MINKITKQLSKLKENKFWHNLFKNSFFAVIGEASSSLINLAVVIFLIRILGAEGYGILILAQAYMTIVDTLVNMQSWSSVIKYSDEAKAKNNAIEYHGYLKLGSILDITTAIIGFILCYFLAGFVGNILNWSPLLINCAKIFSFVIIFHFSGTPTAILRMENKFNLVAIQKIISALIKVIAFVLIIIFYGKLSVIGGVIIYAITDIIGHLILTIMAFHLIHKKIGLLNVIKAPIPSKAKEFTKFTIWQTLTDAVDLPVQQFDVFIISKLSLEMVAIFKVFKQLISVLSKITTPLCQAIFPEFSRLSATSKNIEGYNVVLKIRNVTLKYILPISIIVGLTSYWWLSLVFGSLYGHYWYIFTIYLIAHTIALSYTTIHPYFVSLGQVFYSFIYVLISNIIYIFVAYFATINFGMLGLIISYIIQYSIVISLKNIRIKKVLKLNKKTLIAN